MFRIAYTGITWGFDGTTAAQAVEDVAALGYAAYETIGRVIEEYEQANHDGFDVLLSRFRIPLCGVYCKAAFHDPRQADAACADVLRWARRGAALGASVLILQAGSREPGPYTSADQWRGMARVFGDIAREVAGDGLITTIHPHTGTLVETRAEIDAILGAVDPDLVSFAPDTGQILKAGGDPIATLQAHKASIRHVHLKDYGGGRETGYMGYEAVGSGVLDVEAVFRVLSECGFDGWVSVELDGTPQAPRPPREAAAMSRRYLQDLLGDRAAWAERSSP